jgi:YidC/Oxa1 family membrane protein insertase
MNQTRSFLMIAWLVVAGMLWMAWNQTPSPATVAPNDAPATVPANTAVASPQNIVSALPGAGDNSAAILPGASSSPLPPVAASTTITLQNDVLKLTVDLKGGRLIDSQLLAYTVEKKAGSPKVELLSSESTHYFNAQSGLIAVTGNQQRQLPETFHTEDGRNSYALTPGAESLQVPLLWADPESGLSVRRTLTLTRDSYVLGETEQVSNNGHGALQLYPFEQLERVAPPPPVKHSGLANAESLSFLGVAWYSPENNKYDTAKFDKQLFDTTTAELQKTDTTGGWVAMVQHHFVAAWVPNPTERQKFILSTESLGGVPVYEIRSIATPLQLAPGATGTHSAKLWIGPKLGKQLAALAPGLDRAVFYSSYTILAVLADGLFWVLSHLNAVIGNWGWSIIAIVVLLKLLLYPLSAKQYQSMAKMRAVQPRIEALKERYGDDKQQFQIAMMELYKKEKINPIGGCLPMLLPIPIFIALYDLLLESVELRHAPWMGWIQSLTDPDPYFILPVLNLGVMFLTQKMTPTPGMDPMQKKMMQFMPLVFGVMMAFFPAGLVLYWVTNGLLGLLQQQYITRRHGQKPVVATIAK